MTSRARLMIAACMIGLAIGLLRNQDGVTLISLATLIWICFSWLLLVVRVYRLWPHLEISRAVETRVLGDLSMMSDDAIEQKESSPFSGLSSPSVSDRKTLWCQHAYRMRVAVSSPKRRLPPLTLVHDVIPQVVEPLTGSYAEVLDLPTKRVEIAYSFQPLAAGRARFGGVRFLFQDSLGLFFLERCQRDVREYRILPEHPRLGEMRPLIKRTNALPQHGIHPLQRAGFGSEMLELREYQDGDPPKSIAWKISARRDRLMTRQYESEVPVRVMMFLAQSSLLKWGKLGERPIDRLHTVAAGMARTIVATGDAVGITIVGDQPTRSKSGSQVPLKTRRVSAILGDRGANRVLEAISDEAFNNLDGLEQISLANLDQIYSIAQENYPEWLLETVNSPPLGFFSLSPGRRKRSRSRYQLSMLFAELYQLSDHTVVRMTVDDELFANFANQFVSDHGGLLSPSDSLGWAVTKSYRFNLLQAISQEIQRTVAHAKDNEVYVLFIEILCPSIEESRQCLDAVLPALRVARARHHRVVVVSTAVGQGGSFHRADKWRDEDAPSLPLAQEVMQRVLFSKLRENSEWLRRELRRIGVSFVWVEDQDIIRYVMRETELAAGGRASITRSR